MKVYKEAVWGKSYICKCGDPNCYRGIIPGPHFLEVLEDVSVGKSDGFIPIDLGDNLVLCEVIEIDEYTVAAALTRVKEVEDGSLSYQQENRKLTQEIARLEKELAWMRGTYPYRELIEVRRKLAEYESASS